MKTALPSRVLIPEAEAGIQADLKAFSQMGFMECQSLLQ